MELTMAFKLLAGGWICYFALSSWVRRQQRKPFEEEGHRLDQIEEKWKDAARTIPEPLAVTWYQSSGMVAIMGALTMEGDARSNLPTGLRLPEPIFRQI
eukprot:Skav202806  [mRNA]  locus=scaffold326:967547:968685:+ [translate_table: standard]